MDKNNHHIVYINARVRGMKSRLFTRAQYEQIIDRGTVQAVVDALMESSYEQDMAEALTQHTGADAVEDALSRSLVNTFNRLLHMTQGEHRDLAELFFLRWDLDAVKALLRARHYGLDAQTGAGAFFPGPTLTTPLVRHLAGLESMDALVHGLIAWNGPLAGVLTPRLKEYQESGSVAVLEEALDWAYFVENARALKGDTGTDAVLLRTLLSMEIDRINIRVLLQFRDAAGDAAGRMRQLLPEGLLSRPALEAMAGAADGEEALQVLATTRYGELVEGVLQYAQHHRFSPLDRSFELLMIRWLQGEARRHVFSMAVLMHFGWLTFNEVKNLRMIAWGETRHLPRGRIREEVMYA